MEELKSQGSSGEESKDVSTIFPFNTVQIRKIFEAGLDMNTVFILEVVDKSIDIGGMFKGARVQSWIQTLTRKQFITANGFVSSKGKSLLYELSGGSVEKFKEKIDMFKTWWETYPRTAQFTYKGMTFKSVQVKRINEKACRALWEECLAEGYTPEQIISGTRNHFKVAMELSIKEKENKIQFISNSETYLRRRAFVGYFEKENKGENIDSVDI